jgi:hypothetical protein
VVCILIFYLNFLIDPRYCHRLSMGLLAGLAGGLAFLSKSYVFFFFIIHYALSNLYYLKISPVNRKIISKNLLLGFLVFFVISGIWIRAISEKYGKITVGTAGSYNYALIGPDSNGHPMFNGLLKPPNTIAISAWEDPSYIKIKNWNPLASKENFLYQLKVIYSNILKIIQVLNSFSIFSLLIIIIAIIYFFKDRDKESKNKIFILLLTIIIFASGYSFILIEDRYMWFICILLLLGIYLVETIFKAFSSKQKIKNILIFLLAWSFIIYPTLTISEFSGSGLEDYKLAESLKNQGLQGNVASNNQWETSIYMVYYANSRYYSQTNSKGIQLEKS